MTTPKKAAVLTVAEIMAAREAIHFAVDWWNHEVYEATGDGVPRNKRTRTLAQRRDKAIARYWEADRKLTQLHLDRGYPKPPTEAQLAKAIRKLGIAKITYEEHAR